MSVASECKCETTITLKYARNTCRCLLEAPASSALCLAGWIGKLVHAAGEDTSCPHHTQNKPSLVWVNSIYFLGLLIQFDKDVYTAADVTSI